MCSASLVMHRSKGGIAWVFLPSVFFPSDSKQLVICIQGPREIVDIQERLYIIEWCLARALVEILLGHNARPSAACSVCPGL